MYFTNFKDSSLNGRAKVEMGINKKALYFTLLPEGTTFCVDMQRPYMLKLKDDRYHDMILSWEGYEEAKDMLKTWLNEPNHKTGVKNWAEMIYMRNSIPRNVDSPLKISYAPRKVFGISKILPEAFDSYDFPDIMFTI